MSKAVKAVIRLNIPAGQAKPSPPVGPALGQAGLNIMGFCKDFNAKSSKVKPGIKLPVRLTAYLDKTYDYKIRLPPVSFFLLEASGAKDGANKPGDEIVGTVSLKHVYEIARLKCEENRDLSMRAWCTQIIGCARSMGIHVVPKPQDAM